MTRESDAGNTMPAGRPTSTRPFVALLLATAFVVQALPAAAAVRKPPTTKASECYSPAQHQAEQAVRMHTELMVVGLTCQSVMPDKNPFGQYQDFTVKNRAFISQSEKSMMDYFRAHGRGNPTSQFDTYRTNVANEVSRRASIIGIDTYCQTFVDRATAAASLTADDLRVLTTDEKGAGLLSLSARPLCGVKVVSGPDAPYAVATADKPSVKAAKKPVAKTTPAKAVKTTKPKPKNPAVASLQ